MRCLYYHNHRCISGGWCKASWIADVFRMDLRNIKAARKHLVTIGWLQMLDTPQTLCNRWGSYILVNLSWTRAAMEKTSQDDAQTPSSESPPPPAFSTTTLPPPHKAHREPLQELQHQKPAAQAAYFLSPLQCSRRGDQKDRIQAGLSHLFTNSLGLGWGQIGQDQAVEPSFFRVSKIFFGAVSKDNRIAHHRQQRNGNARSRLAHCFQNLF